MNSDSGLFVGRGHPFVWRRVTAVAPNLEVAEGEHREVLYGSASGLYRSVDGGKNWARISCDFGVDRGVDRGGVAVSTSDPSSLYQVGSSGSIPPLTQLGGYYRSTDGGKTWSRSTVGATRIGPDLQAVAVDPTNPNDVTIAPYLGGIFRTSTGNDWTFTRLPGPVHRWWGSSDQHVEMLAYGAGANPLLWAGTTSGAFRRMPDGAWAPAGLSGHDIWVFPDARVASVAFAVLGLNGTGRYCVRRTTNSGKTWLPVSALPCGVVGMSVTARDDAIYAWTFRTSHTLYRSRDHGATWVRLPPLPVG